MLITGGGGGGNRDVFFGVNIHGPLAGGHNKGEGQNKR